MSNPKEEHADFTVEYNRFIHSPQALALAYDHYRRITPESLANLDRDLFAITLLAAGEVRLKPESRRAVIVKRLQNIRRLASSPEAHAITETIRTLLAMSPLHVPSMLAAVRGMLFSIAYVRAYATDLDYPGE